MTNGFWRRKQQKAGASPVGICPCFFFGKRDLSTDLKGRGLFSSRLVLLKIKPETVPISLKTSPVRCSQRLRVIVIPYHGIMIGTDIRLRSPGMQCQAHFKVDIRGTLAINFGLHGQSEQKCKWEMMAISAAAKYLQNRQSLNGRQ